MVRYYDQKQLMEESSCFSLKYTGNICNGKGGMDASSQSRKLRDYFLVTDRKQTTNQLKWGQVEPSKLTPSVILHPVSLHLLKAPQAFQTVSVNSDQVLIYEPMGICFSFKPQYQHCSLNAIASMTAVKWIIKYSKYKTNISHYMKTKIQLYTGFKLYI